MPKYIFHAVGTWRGYDWEIGCTPIGILLLVIVILLITGVIHF